jgi:hypothetical protein
MRSTAKPVAMSCPRYLARREGRRAWLKEAKQRLERERAEREKTIPKAREERLELCHRRLVEDWKAERQANRDYEANYERGVRERGKQAMGSGPNRHEPPEKPEGKINTTDPDARRMKFGRNFIPAYNVQAVTTEDQIVVAAEITTEGVDFEQLEPMMVRPSASSPTPASPSVPRSCWPTRATGRTTTSTR